MPKRPTPDEIRQRLVDEDSVYYLRPGGAESAFSTRRDVLDAFRARVVRDVPASAWQGNKEGGALVCLARYPGPDAEVQSATPTRVDVAQAIGAAERLQWSLREIADPALFGASNPAIVEKMRQDAEAIFDIVRRLKSEGE